MESQKLKILEYMKEHGAITPMEALSEFGCFRLSARIHDLRAMGYSINTVQVVSNGKWFARYYLESEDGGQTDVC